MKRNIFVFFVLVISVFFLIGCNSISSETTVPTIPTTLTTTTATTITTTNTSNVTTDNTTTIITRSDLDIRLLSIYDLAVQAEVFEGTYEEWLETVQGPQGEPGTEVLLQVASGYIQWQYVGDTEWTNLVELATLVGPAGADGIDGIDGTDGLEVTFQVASGYIQWQYVGDTEWTNLVELATLVGPAGADGADGINGTDGLDGLEVTFQVASGYIQWQYVGDTEWTNLVELATLVGPAGADGADGINGTDGLDGLEVTFQVASGYIQWQYVGDTEWTNLVELATLVGPAGADGADGINGTDGTDGLEVTFQVASGYIQWQYVGDTEWTNLVELATLVGPAGVDGIDGINGTDGTDGLEVTFQIASGYIQWQYVGDTEWVNLVELATLVGPAGADGIDGINGTDGTDGLEVTFQVASGYIQWQYVGDTEWVNLVELATLVGPAGVDGINGTDGTDGLEVTFQVASGYIQWQYVGDTEWTNLIEVATLAGATGEQGVSVSIIEINEYGELIVTLSDSSVQNLGQILRTFTVTFKDFNGYVLDVQTIVYEQDAIAPSDPTRIGYTFTGWNIEFVNITGNLDVIAEYSTDTYSVTFDSNGGTEETTLDNIQYGSTITIPIPEKAGYYFGGWFIGTSINDMQFTSQNTVTEDLTLYARWNETEFTVTFVDYDDSILSTQMILYGYSAFKPENPTKVGYTFSSWDSSYSYITSDLIIQALYIPNNYTITFNSNGGTEVTNYTAAYETILPDFETPNKVGYSFLGWYEDESLTTLFEVNTMPFEGEILYAKWVINQYSVIYEDYDSTVLQTEEFDYEADLSGVTAPSDPSRVGYTFSGWDTSVPATMPANDVVITATYTVNQYTITFDSKGGTEVTSITQDYETTVIEPDNPTKEIYSFSGWYSDEALTTPYTFTTIPAENITLYAAWTINQYSLTFEDYDGTVLQTADYDYDSDLSGVTAPSDPSREGYTFSGWDTSIPATMPLDGLVITATYTVNQYTITFDSNGGSVVDSITQDYGTTVTTPLVPTKVGYYLDGWYSDEAFTTQYSFTTMPAEDTTVYAKWKAERPEDYTFVLIDETYTVTGYIGTDTDIVIPSTYMGRPVTSIGAYAFDSNNSLTSVVIPEGVTSIGTNAFYECTNIVSVTMPDSLITIGDNAFQYCYSLTNIIIPYGVTTIGREAFYRCSSLTSIVIPDSVTSIGTNAFSYCLGLTSIVISNSLTSIEYRVFSECPSVISIVIPDSVTHIETRAFEGCTNLISIIIPASVTYIRDLAFVYCDNLTIYAEPESQPAGWDEDWNPNYRPVVWGYDGVSRTYSFVTNGGSLVEDITDYLLDTEPLTTKEGYYFAGWYDNPELSGYRVLFPYFTADSSKTTLYTAWSETPIENSVDYNFALIGETYIVIEYIGTDTDIVIPSTYMGRPVTSIGAYAFDSNNSLTSVVIPEGVTSIGTNAFYECTNIVSVTMPDSLITIGDNAFQYCYSLTNIIIPYGVTTIGREAFYRCSSLTSIVIPDSVTSIGTNAFSYCLGLTSIVISNSLTSIEYRVFSECPSVISIVIPDSVTHIETRAFEGCTNLISIIIPASVTYIRDLAFVYCDNLTIYAEPESQPAGWDEDWNPNYRPVVWGYDGVSRTYSFVTNGGSLVEDITDYLLDTEPLTTKEGYYFAGWYDNPELSGYRVLFPYFTADSSKTTLYTAWSETPIENSVDYNFALIGETYIVIEYIGTDTDIVIPSTYMGRPVTSIGAYAFDSNNSLTSVVIPEGVTSIGTNAFYECTNIVSVTMPDSLITIGDNAFQYCYSLTNIIIPYGVTTIGREAFYRCSSLTSIVIPDSVTSIGTNAFSYCLGLTSIVISNSLTSIEYRVFSECPSVISIVIPDSVTHIETRAFEGCTNLISIIIPASVTYIRDLAFVYCDNLTIYAEPESQPAGWDEDWNPNYRPVVWGYVIIRESTITFDTNGGSEVTAITQDEGTEINEPTNPTKTGYSFNGWYSDEALTTPYTFTTMPNEDMTLYAKWSLNVYILTIEDDLGNVVANYDISYGLPLSSIAAPNKTGYTFTSWSGLPSTMPANDVVATAIYTVNQYTITYIDYEDYVIQVEEYDYGADLSVVIAPDGTYRIGYTFSGWDIALPETMPANNIVLTTTYEINQYTISYQDYDGSLIEILEYDYMYDLSGITCSVTPIREGYIFSGWDSALPATMPANDVVITATYSIYQYTLIYEDYDGTLLQSGSYDYEADLSGVTPPTDPSREGYTFIGWDSILPATMPANDVVITATYTIGQYSITFDSNGGSAVTAIIQDYGTTVTEPTNPTKEGNSFTGWFSDETLTQSYTFTTMPAEDTTLYAKWVANQYTVSYKDYNGYVLQVSVINYGADLSAVTSPADPTREGYTFNGWDSTLPETMPANDVVITATYTINQYKLAFEDYNGTVIQRADYDYGADLSGVTLPTDPIRENYTFSGWDLTIPETMPAEDVVITATYTINQYTLTYEDYDGTVLQSASYAFGADLSGVTPPTNPTLVGGTFSGWDSTLPETMPANNIIITATYTVNQYTLAFVDYDGTVIQRADYDYEADLSGVIPPIDPTRDGYTFSGWNDVIPETMPAADLTIIATYTVNQFNLIYGDYDDTIIQSVSYDYGADLSGVLPPTDPSRIGFTFTGWNTTPPETMPANDVFITATYIINQYTMTYKDYNGYVLQVSVITYGADLSGVTPPTDPTREGYTFVGWDSTLPETMPANDVVITAIYTTNQYTLAYEDYNGTVIQRADYDFGTDLSGVTPPADPTRDNYTFVGWDIILPETMPANDVIITATYTINQYTLAYEDYNGTVIQRADYDIGADLSGVTPPTDPTREGYTFSGWDSTLPETMPENDVVITATYTINQYTITFDSNGGSVVTAITQDFETTVEEPVNPTKVENTFVGWYSDSELTTAYTFTTMPGEDITLYAKWTVNQYTLAFEDYNGTVIQRADYDYEADLSGVTVPSDPSRIGYTFSGWDSTLPETMPANDVVITATYTINQYTITFDSNGGSAVIAITQNFGTTVEEPDIPTKTEHTFGGWYSDAELTVAYTFTTMPGENITLYAKWNINEYTVTYEDYDGSVLQSAPYDFGTDLSGVVPPIEPIREGYTFAGWDSTLPETMPANDVVITATYTINQYTITFKDYNGYVLNVQIMVYGSDLSTATIPDDPVREGYTFAGWDSTLPETMPADDIVITATYSANQYTITFDSNGGSTVTSITQEAESVVLEPTNPTKSGYTFSGWYSDAELSIEYTITTMPTEDITLYAKWTINQYSVIYKDYDDTVLQSASYDYEADLSGVTPPTDPSRIAYTFSGWDNSIPATMPANDVVITATYTINQYTISFDTNGGTSVPAITQNYDTDVTEPAEPTKTDYYFDGWYSDSELTVEYSFTTMPAENITLYAAWSDEPNGSSFEAAIEINVGDTLPVNIDTLGEWMYYVFTPLETVNCNLYSSGEFDTYVEIYNSSLELIIDDDSSGTLSNFLLNFEFVAGNTYYVIARIDWDNEIGEFTINLKETTSNDLNFEFALNVSGTYNITGYEGTETEIEFPSSYLGIPVTAIVLDVWDTFDFWDNEDITSIVIPSSITMIASNTFLNCPNLTIYAEASSEGVDWQEDWNADPCPVIWGYDGVSRTYTFEENGGSIVSDIISPFTIDEPVTTKDGYLLLGWYDNAELTGEIVEFPYYTTDPSKTTLYAAWGNTPNGESFAWAIEIALGDELPVIIDTAGEWVYYTFTPTETLTYEIFSSGEYDTFGCIYNSGYSLIIEDDDDGAGYNFLLEYELQAGNTYYIVVKMLSDEETGEFTLHIEEKDYFVYSLIEGAWTITGYTGTATNIEIPSTYSGNPVTSINMFAFMSNTTLTSVVIPSSITTISDYAFYQCTNLTIYAEAASKPAGWSTDWNIDPCPVIWGCDGTTRTYTFEENGGTTVTDVTSNIAVDEPNITRTDYYLIGWYDNAELTGEIVVFPYYTTDPSKTTLYAAWSDEVVADGTFFDTAFEITYNDILVVNIDTADEWVYYTFTPTETLTYLLYSSGEYDTYGYLYNSGYNLITENDDYVDLNFGITYELQAGSTYYIVVRMYDDTEIGQFTISVTEYI
ncbi:InlB B-repeat-containing protein [Mycoplasmatota bacterium WC30]